jgi:peptide/nickel transport system substrate-binding protein
MRETPNHQSVDVETGAWALVEELRTGRIGRRQFFERGAALGLGGGFLGSVLAACGGSSVVTSSGSGTTKGAAVATASAVPTGVESVVGKFDPQVWAGFTSNIATNHMYQGLVRLNFANNAIEPCLATSWEQPDPKTWIFHLREGVTFHNGSPFTADDVVFSTLRAKQVSWGVYGLSNFESIKALDPKTVQVKLTNPDWRFKWFYYWPPGAVLSKAYFDKVGATEAAAKPVGTNAFQFVSSNATQTVLKKYPDYWEKGLPMIEGFTLDTLAGTTIVTGLKTGQVGLSPDVDFDLLKTVKGFSNVGLDARVGPHIVLSAFNTLMKPFNDVLVRRAVAEALDNAAALSAYPTQFYLPSKGALIHPSFDYNAYAETNSVYTSDLAKAKQMLSASSAPNGFTASWIVTATRAQEVSAVLGAQQQLSKIGITINIKQMQDADVAAALYKRPRPFEMITYNWLHNMPNTLDPLSALYTTANVGGTNWSGYSNPEFDHLVTSAINQTNEADAANQLKQLQVIATRDVPCLPHGWDGVRRAFAKDLSTPPQSILAEWDDWYRTTRHV